MCKSPKSQHYKHRNKAYDDRVSDQFSCIDNSAVDVMKSWNTRLYGVHPVFWWCGYLVELFGVWREGSFLFDCISPSKYGPIESWNGWS